ncbi:tetratricopeptide repeat protein [Streptomyces sp. AC512_CC834]|uniref:tetratricopeptide repeat protein n=1 Tax=Streptomyces sp. AC512_CC834 TaxID=2823691 RepID=UPI001C276397|nr:tetratricopeptide repeat protein [Streptomyces sp. AC512_CC834]
MSRLGRDKQRDHGRAERSPDLAATPIDVRVPEADSGARSASVDGSLVVAAPGEEIQNAVLNRLHHLALALGHPVLATIHDRRIGYSVPLRVDPDGSSHLAAEPVPTAPEEAPGEAPEETPEDAIEEAPVRQDRATHVLRPVEPVRDGVSAPTFTLRALPEPAESAPRGTAPGTVAPPTGAFGPPPSMDGASTTGTSEDAEPQPVPGPFTAPRPAAAPEPVVAPRPTAAPEPVVAPKPVPARKPEAVPERKAAPASDLVRDLDPDPKPTPTPARGFDAVAEAVLGDEPITAPGDATVPALLAEPTSRINEAVKEGRTEAAARLAEQTVTDASQTLGPEHPEVLRLRELTAYIAYLSGDPGRAFHLSLDLSRIHRRTGDAEAAYGNVQSAATAWRAVRDPARGLELGRDLVGLWDELAAEQGPAAEDAEQLESARARMSRLADRVRAQTG